MRDVQNSPADNQDGGALVARIRTIKPEFPQSESLGRVSRDARLLFINLWTVVDDEGRSRAASRLLASLLYPYDDDAPTLIDGWIAELEGIGAVRRYKVDGSTYLDIPNWLKHQKIDKPTASRLPAFAEESREVAKAREESSTDLGPRTVDLGPWTVDRPARVNPHAKPTNLINGADNRKHGEHAYCLQGRRPSLCVTTRMLELLADKAGGNIDEVKQWLKSEVFPNAIRELGDGPAPDALEFWTTAVKKAVERREKPRRGSGVPGVPDVEETAAMMRAVLAPRVAS